MYAHLFPLSDYALQNRMPTFKEKLFSYYQKQPYNDLIILKEFLYKTLQIRF